VKGQGPSMTKGSAGRGIQSSTLCASSNRLVKKAEETDINFNNRTDFITTLVSPTVRCLSNCHIISLNSQLRFTRLLILRDGSLPSYSFSDPDKLIAKNNV